MLGLRGGGREFRRRVFFTKKQWYERLSITIPISVAALALSFQYYLWKQRQPKPDSAIVELELRFKSEREKVVTDSEVLEMYIQAQRSWHTGRVPRAILFPSSHDDVEQMVKMCHRYKVPITPCGHRTSLRGSTVLSKSGIVLNLSNLRKIKEIDAANQMCIVEPGVTIGELNEKLSQFDLWLPFDEYRDMTIGGLAGLNAFSQYSTRRSFRSHVMSLKIVLPNGHSVKTKNRNDYGNAGYSLNDLFIGSEGTLGVTTKLALALEPRPKNIKFAVKRAVPLSVAIQESTRLHTLGKTLAEELTVLPTGHTSLYISYTGETPAGFAPTVREEMHVGPKAFSVFASIGVPVGLMEATIEDAKKTMRSEELKFELKAIPARGEMIVEVENNLGDIKLREHAERVLIQLSDRAILKEGTCAVNYGIGTDLATLLETDVGANSVALQRKIKSTIDPYFLMNPGKVLPGTQAPTSFLEMLLRKLKQFWLE